MTPTPETLRADIALLIDGDADAFAKKRALAAADAWAASEQARQGAERRIEWHEDVGTLAGIIRLVDGSHSLGAGALAEAIIGQWAALAQTCPECGLPANGHSCPVCQGER